MHDVTLPPELERFATEAVAAGRYRDMSAVVEAGLALVRQTEAQVADFVASLEDAKAEGERDGLESAEEVHREMTFMLDEMARANA